MTPAVDLEGARRTFNAGATEVQALAGVSLQIPHGVFAALLGPSGSGKSTLLSTVGLLDGLDSGSYRLHGFDVSALTASQRAVVRARAIGFVFQSYFLIPTRTIERNVELGALYRGVGRKERRRRARQAIDAVGMTHRIGFRSRTLSGGEKQRVAIARAIINSPPVLLADEPTGNLDRMTGQLIIDVLTEVNRSGTTLLVATHDPAVADRADCVFEMTDGSLTTASGRAALSSPPSRGEAKARSDGPSEDSSAHS